MGGEVGWWEGWRGMRGRGRKKCRPAPNVLEILPIFLCRIFQKLPNLFTSSSSLLHTL